MSKASSSSNSEIDFNDPRIVTFVNQLGPLISSQLKNTSSACSAPSSSSKAKTIIPPLPNSLYKSPTQSYPTIMSSPPQPHPKSPDPRALNQNQSRDLIDAQLDALLRSSKMHVYSQYYSKWVGLIADASSGITHEKLRFEDVPWPIPVRVKSPLEYERYFDNNIRYPRILYRASSSSASFSPAASSRNPDPTGSEILLLTRFIQESPEFLAPLIANSGNIQASNSSSSSSTDRIVAFSNAYEFHFHIWHPDTIGRYLFNRVLSCDLYNVHGVYIRLQRFLYGKEGFFKSI